jgi:magnesium chelatase family protein
LIVLGVATLSDAIRVAAGEYETAIKNQEKPDNKSDTIINQDTLSQVKGQAIAKRAMLIAAAGGHNLIFIGPPGCGKSMLAQRFCNLIPSLSDQERFEAVKIHSIAGLPLKSLLNGEPPFRSPHHVVSDVGLVGGGATPKPGEISLAHRGVLFLDEFPEYRRSALEALRTPLETGQVRISRAKGSALLPARFQLLAAMNPCPCGRLGSKQHRCICSESMLQLYLRRLSQPILERIDIQVELEEVAISDLTLTTQNQSVSDSELRERVITLRSLQLERQESLNSRLEGEKLLSPDSIDRKALRLLEETARKSLISARSFMRILRIARTIADLEESLLTTERHLAEAISYRVLDRRQTRSLARVA